MENSGIPGGSRRLVIVVAIAALLIALHSVFSQLSAPEVFDADDTEIAVSPGDRFSVKVSDDPADGYRWIIAEPRPDPAVLRAAGAREHRRPAPGRHGHRPLPRLRGRPAGPYGLTAAALPALRHRRGRREGRPQPQLPCHRRLTRSDRAALRTDTTDGRQCPRALVSMRKRTRRTTADTATTGAERSP